MRHLTLNQRKMGKFLKRYTNQSVQNTLNFYRKRVGEPSHCTYLNDCLNKTKIDTKNKVILHLNNFIIWWQAFFESLPNDDVKREYLDYVIGLWKQKNEMLWRHLPIEPQEYMWSTNIRKHLDDMFNSFFRNERKKLINKVNNG